MTTISNPVVRGTQPDPSVVRVGRDYYLVNSSFDLLPGLQIRHSRNLIDWELIGAAVVRPAQYRRDGRSGPISLFAPTLRYHDGEFFLVCTNVADDQGNFLLRTRDPAGGWSDATWIDRGAFDPSLLFDEGRCYYTRRTLDPLPDGRLGPVVQAEIDIDTGALGPMRELTPDHQGFCSNDIEGPHLYRIGDWYYLFSAEGGSWAGHMQTCGRSAGPWGPFEPAPHNPVLTHRHRVAHLIQTLGHADLVDDVHGNWWALALGTRHTARGGFVQHHNLGRETFLAPVEWVQGWPVIGHRGTIELAMEVDRPRLEDTPPSTPASSPLWRSGWRGIGTHPSALDRMAGDPIRLEFGGRLDQAPESDLTSPVGALLLPQTEDFQRFTAHVELPDAGAVGVAVFTDRRHCYEATIRRVGNSVIAGLTRTVDDLQVVDQVELPVSDRFRFTIDADEEVYRFTVEPLSGEPVLLGSGRARLLSAEAVEWFVGVQFALTASGVPSGSGVFSGVERRDVEPTERIDGANEFAATPA